MILICVPQAKVDTYSDSPVKDAWISLERVPIARNVRRALWQADVGHYVDISRQGYQRVPFDVNDRRSQAFAFFPLHPILLWLLGHVTEDVFIWGAALSNVFFFFALVLLYRLTLAFGYDDSVARRTIFYLAAFPASYFFSIPLTESLFVFLTVASFYAAKREHWWAAGVIGLFASATRLPGVLLLPSLLVLSWQMYRSVQVRKILWLLLVPFGLFAYMFYSWRLSGDPLAFKHAAEAWGRLPSIFLVTPLINYFIHPHAIVLPWNIQLLNAIAGLLGIACIYILARRREWALALYTFMSVALPLSSGMLQSLGRYTMAFFPIFIALAIVAKSERLDLAIRFVFVFLLGILTLLYAATFTNALA